MNQSQDSGEAWLRTLDPGKRPIAREWMDMPAPEFQGRMAMVVMDLKEELSAIRTPVLKKAVYAVVGVASLIGAYVSGSGQVPR